MITRLSVSFCNIMLTKFKSRVLETQASLGSIVYAYLCSILCSNNNFTKVLSN